jgi:hypothetical protein
MRARYKTRCPVCRRQIIIGNLIVIPRSGRAVHAGCGDETAGRAKNSESNPGDRRTDKELLQAKLDRYEAAGFR